MAVTVGSKGLGVLRNLALMILTLYGALAVFIIVVLGAVALLIRLPIRTIHPVWSKEPALPRPSRTNRRASRPFRWPWRIWSGSVSRGGSSAFVLPMGYSFNLDGSTLYLSLAAVFVAQASNIQLSLGQQLLILLTLMPPDQGDRGRAACLAGRIWPGRSPSLACHSRESRSFSVLMS
jgi:proton glutamate symport protein